MAGSRERLARPAPDVRRRAHLVSLPMDDSDENAAMVNAIQRRAEIVVQKSLAEGFGLTVAEAMWKRRPVIGTRVGGIQDQIVDGESGLLIDDPRDLEALAKAIRSLADDRERAGELAAAGRERVRETLSVADQACRVRRPAFQHRARRRTMSDPTYPDHREADVVLHDGSTVSLRPVRPDDGELLRGAVRRARPRLAGVPVLLRRRRPGPRRRG